MANSLRLILSVILLLSLIQPGNAKTSTENLIVNESDILELKKSSEIDEADFFEDVQTNSEEHVWVVNLKNGPFSTKEKANQAALKLKKNIGGILPKLPKEISILQKPNSPNHKNFNKAKYAWMTNLRLGVYNSKDKALQIAHELKVFQSVPENVFLTREIKGIKTSKFAEKITPDVIGQIFLSREVTPVKDKTKHFILVATRSNSLNVRKNPSSSSPVVASLIRGSKVPHIKNNTPENRDGSWLYVEYSKGKFGWVSSSYTKKIIDVGSSISQQASLKTLKPKQVQKNNAPRTSELLELKSLVTLLQTQLDKIKTDKVLPTGKTNQANTKEKQERLARIEKFEALKNKSSAEINDLQTITASLRSELNKIKSDKSNAIKARNRSRAELEISVDKSNKKIIGLKITTASLLSELTQIKADKTKAVEASNQAKARLQNEKLANAKEFKNLKEKSSKQIKGLKTTTASILSRLDKVKKDKAQAIEATNQANAKANDEKLASTKEKKILKEKINTLRIVLERFKADKEKITQATNQANAKANDEKLANAKEFKNLKEKSSKQIKDLKTTTASLLSELTQIKTVKAQAIEASNQANSKAKEERLASSKEFQSLKETSSKQIKVLKTTTASLLSELTQIKTDKTQAIEASNQANSKAKEEKLASAKEFQNLKETNSKQIKVLKTTTASLLSELTQIKAGKAQAIEASNQANSKAKQERLASSKEFQNLKETNSKQIKNLQTTTASLRLELENVKKNKTKIIEASNQVNSKAKQERLASAKEFQSLKETNSKQIKVLKTTTASLLSELTQIKTDKTQAIEATNQANAKANDEKLASTKEKKILKEKINTLRIVLERFKADKEKITQATNQANAKANDEKLANAKEFKNLKEKSSKQIKDLKTTTASLLSELTQIKTDKTQAIEASNQANAKAKQERLASSKEFQSLKETNSKQIKVLKTTTASLLSELTQLKTDKAQMIEASNQANSKAKEEKLASAKEFQNLKEQNSEQIKILKTTTVSLRLEIDKIKNDKAKAVEASNQTKTRLQNEKLANAKLVTSLKVNNEKEISNLKEKNNNKTKILKEIFDLRFSTASLQKELKKINSEKEDAIINFNQVNAKLQATGLNNFKFTKKLKDTVLSLRKQLDKIKEEKTESTRLINQTNDQLEAKILTISTEIKNIKEASHEETLELKNTVSYLRAQLNKAKNDKTNKLTAINQASIQSNKKLKESSTREIKTLNSTIKNLRTVLEKFKVERLKEAKTIKFRETKIATDQKIREREISLLKKESITLKRQLDKINLNRLKAIEGVNQNTIAAQADHIAQENKFKNFRLESAGEIAKLRGETTLLRNQLAHLKADRTKSSQPKTLLSSSKKLSGLTGHTSTKQKNKSAGFPDQQVKKKAISEKKLLPPSNKVNPENIIKSKLLHWVNAWESRNVPLYLSFYSKSFKDPKRSRSKWEAYRRKSLEKALSITIKISNIKIYSSSKKSIKITFSQRFKSNRFSDIGLKELVWKKGTDGWKIIRENWKPQ